MAIRIRDEDVLSDADLQGVINEILGPDHGFVLEIKKRAGRSEKVSLIFQGEAAFSVAHNSRKPGLSRLALRDVLLRMQEICVQTASKMQQNDSAISLSEDEDQLDVMEERHGNNDGHHGLDQEAGQ